MPEAFLFVCIFSTRVLSVVCTMHINIWAPTVSGLILHLVDFYEEGKHFPDE
jgi:hypothetical protein